MRQIPPQGSSVKAYSCQYQVRCVVVQRSLGKAPVAWAKELLWAAVLSHASGGGRGDADLFCQCRELEETEDTFAGSCCRNPLNRNSLCVDMYKFECAIEFCTRRTTGAVLTPVELSLCYCCTDSCSVSACCCCSAGLGVLLFCTSADGTN